MDGRRYKHLGAEDRAAVMLGRAEHKSMRTIAAALGRSVSTISREIHRMVGAEGSEKLAPVYSASAAAEDYRERRLRCGRRRKLEEGSALFGTVRDHLLYRRWSPEQISSRLKQLHPDDASRQVSHETIYASIYAYPRGSLRDGMVEALRQRKPRRGRRRSTLSRGFSVPEELRIIHRPEEVESRQMPGHWEGDFIKGAYNRSGVGTLVERKTRFVILCKMDGCTAQDAVEGFTRQMKRLPAFLRESLTYDRGVEMACHEELAKRLNLKVWFADPYAPWQRGSNENTNGLLRQFMPKGTDLSTWSQTALNDVAKLMNGRPRETLGWKTPAEVLDEVIKNSSVGVALGS